jgi:putative ABC transport system permease protein
VLRTELLSHPAVISYTTGSLFGGGPAGLEDVRTSPDENARRLSYQSRGGYIDFFTTLGVPLVAGRDFREGDDRPQKIIIDAGTAQRLGMAPDIAIGRTLYQSRPIASSDGVTTSYERPTTEAEIVGVIAEPPYELRSNESGLYIYSMSDISGARGLVRISREDVPGALEHIRSVYARLAPDRELTVRFLDEEFDLAFRMFNRISAGLMALCLMAVAIAAMGLFGMANFVVHRRIREIGVRKALGASSLRVLGLLLWDFSKPVLLANLIAWPIAWIASRFYLDLFVDRIPLTPWPFIAALIVSLAVAWIAVGARVWRAARVKPAMVLKAE